MVDTLKLFYQGFPNLNKMQGNFGDMFALNQQYMRWTEEMLDMCQPRSLWGIGANDYWKFWTNYFNLFQKSAFGCPYSTFDAYQRWYEAYFEKYNEIFQGWQPERTVRTTPVAQEKNYPADWNEEKEMLLIRSVIDGTKEAQTLSSIFEAVGEEIGISPARCSTYWYTKVDQRYRDLVYQIKQEQAKNWTEEEEALLTKIVTEEYPHLSVFQTIPIASTRLKRHKSDVQRKWFSLQKKIRPGMSPMS